MRLSSHQIFLTGLNGILDAQSRVYQLQNQISTGKRISTPADDPIAASQSLSLNQQLSKTDQYDKNATRAENRLNIEETTLGTIEDVIQRVRELAIQAGDGAYNLDDRKAIASEIEQRLQQLLGLANTTDEENQHIFAGFQAGQVPFVAATGGGFNYQGDEGQLFLKVADNIDVAVSDSGKKLFLDVNDPLNFTASPNVGNGGAVVVSNQAVINQAAFDAFHPNGANITFDTTGPTPTYSVTQVPGGAVINGGNPVVPLTAIPYTAGQTIEFEGIHVELTGVPLNGDTVDIVSQPQQKLGLLSAVEKLANGLQALGDNPADRVQLGELIADSLISLDRSQANVLQAEARVGSRLNTIDDVRTNNQNTNLINKQILSELEDLDLAEAISTLSFQSTILEATQQTFVRVSRLSLFNYLN